MDKYERLRSLAEEKLSGKDKNNPELPKEIDELIHELQVHQIELELQNEELKRSRSEIEKLHQKYYNLYNSAPAGYITMDMSTKITEINLIGAELLGLEESEESKYLFNFFIKPEYRDTFRSHVKDALKTGNKQNFELELKRRDKTVFHALIEMIVKFKKRTMYKLVIIDITERKKLEEDLKRSNEELKTFTYVSAHDLQEPLRTIVSFTQLLERRYKGKFDSDADKFMDYIVEASIRMKDQIEGLLEYSRVSKKEEFKPVNTNEILNQTIKILNNSIKESNAKITIEELPNVIGDARQLQKVFQNLISNAIKFRKYEKPLKIHISAYKDEDEKEYVFSIQDNGIGIEEQYNELIFTIFQRLNPRDKYEGTGIGLAIVKKIVEHYGGRIWVESEYGVGSTFYFTIPIEK